MANTKSAQKRIRSDEKRRVRNQAYKSQVKTAIKKAEAAIVAGGDNQEAVRLACSILDKAAGKGILHQNNAARRKSRLVAKQIKANTANAA